MNLNDKNVVGGSLIAIAFFLLIVFASTAIISHVDVDTLGITVGLSVIGILALLILILFAL